MSAPSELPMAAADFAATLTQASPPREPGSRDEPSVGPRLGRFTILERLGAGNMGVVFTAYDDVLDRKIAIKVLRGGGAEASIRLMREAQAMARVDHPNVVTVHEVGTSDDQVYVAMEFIRGVTLQVWQREPGRRWQDIVEAYIQAGRGLAAAHAAGLVHRDFKPSNAMIDADGRVRVLDFGLVRAQGDATPVPLDTSASRHPIAVQLTHAGDVLGTPAYMSPEQIRGQEVGPASDQFGLCVSLYEGLYGHLPFPGDSLGALFRSILRERLPEPPRGSRVPTWVRAALTRGLRADPKARFGSIDALLRALGAGSTRRRHVAIGVAVGAVAAAAIAGFLAARAQAPAVCGGAAAQIAGAYGPPVRARIERTLSAAGPAIDAELRPAVIAALDAYARAWTDTHRDACMAHVRGEQSDLMLDRRMACLAQRRAALGEASTVLREADAGVALEALRIVRELPAIGRCSELDVLASEVAPPSDPAVAVAVEEVRRALARAGALLRAGEIDEALALAARSVEEALRSDYRPLAAEALLVRSRLGLPVTEDPADDERLTRAMLTAIGSGVDEVAAEAAALRPAPEVARISLAEALVARGVTDPAEQAQALVALVGSESAPRLLSALETRDIAGLRSALERRLALLCGGPDCKAPPGAVEITVSPARCELCGGSEIQRAATRFIRACEAAGISRVRFVGGSPNYRTKLAALFPAGGALTVLTTAGDRKVPLHRSRAHQRTDDLVIIWGATELDHATSGAYRAQHGRVEVIAHRGIGRMLELAALRLATP